MELAGVAADIVDASSRTSRGRPSTSTPTLAPTATTASSARRSAASPNNNAAGTLPQAPLELFGCVGEGAPAESMAREALVLWVGVFRLPPQSRALLQGAKDTDQRDNALGDKALGDAGVRGGGGGGGDKGLGDKGVAGGRYIEGGEGVVSRRSRLQALDKPVMKAILCASDAIRQRVAQSLLQACGVGPAAVEVAAAEAAAAAAAATATASAVGGNEVAVAACPEKPASDGNDNASARSSTSSLTAASSEFVESDAMEKEADCAPTQPSEESDHVATAATAASVASSSSAAGACASSGLEKNAGGGEERAPATAALSTDKGVLEEEAVCGAVGKAGGPGAWAGGGGRGRVGVRDELREHVVRLLMDNVPRMAKPGREVGVGEGTRGGVICGSTELRRDCTQLFQVLCALVEELIEVGRRADVEVGGGGGAGVVSWCNFVVVQKRDCRRAQP